MALFSGSVFRLVLFVVVTAVPSCFPDGIPVTQRRNLRQGNDEFPLGLWVNDWAAAYVTSAVVHILIEERLGYNVNETGPGPGSLNAFYALMGCSNPMDLDDRGCGPTTTYNHINMETWAEAYAAEWAEIQSQFPAMAPINAGSMGYGGQTSVFIAKDVQRRAFQQTGAMLDFYRGWDTSWSQPWLFFDNITSINRSSVYRCNETRFFLDYPNKLYLKITGDEQGVERISENHTVALCPDDYFWLSPACRSTPSQCVPYLTGGAGWMLNEVMQKATSFNMPLAIGVAKEYSQLPREVTSAFYWWTPDPTFLDLDPIKISFPEYDFNAWNVGDKRSSVKDAPISKLISQDLSALAPNVEDLVRNIRFQVEDVNIMMMDVLTNGSHLEAACRWLKSKPVAWESWLPDRTKCFPGYGLYDINRLDFVQNREDPTYLECRPCTSGRYSKPFDDIKGSTFACRPCDPGTAQPSFLALFCEPCEMGSYQNFSGQESCDRCGIGSYQDRKGSAICSLCPAGSVTLGLGSVSQSDCGCAAGYIAEQQGNLSCVACGEGLECPPMSSLSSLLSGKNEDLKDYVPYVRENFFSSVAQPLDIYRCLESGRCPGGRPGSCGGGSTSVACTDCPSRQNWGSDSCEDCSNLQVLGWIFVLLFVVVGLPSVYYLLTWQTTAKASVLFATTCAGGMTISTLQNIGILAVERVFVLDIDKFAFSCVAGEAASVRYVATAAFFPVLVLWLCAFARLSWFFPRRFHWEPSKTKSMIGQIMQVSFSTMSSLALAPFACFSHPNGVHSILKYPGITCGSEDHGLMLAVGTTLLLVGVVGFLCICTWAAIMLPKWSLKAWNSRVRSFRFLVFRFRLDSWWFGVPLLLRGPLLSLPIVLATDHAPVQVCFCIVVLMTFLTVEARTWPWKVPLLNLCDCILSFCITMLVVSSALHLQAVQGLMKEFSDFLTAMFMSVLGVIMFLMVGMTCSAVVYRVALGGQKEFAIFNLQKVPSSATLSTQLQSLAEKLANMELKEMEIALSGMNVSDLNILIASVSLLSFEVLSLNEDGVVSGRIQRIRSHSFSASSQRKSSFFREPVRKKLSEIEMLPENDNDLEERDTQTSQTDLLAAPSSKAHEPSASMWV